MNQSNGVALGPLAGWVIACVHGKDLIGKPHYSVGNPDKIISLSPVFELQVKLEVMQVMDSRTRQPARDPNGNPLVQQRTNYSGVPVLLLASLTETMLPEGALVIGIDVLSLDDKKRMAHCVAMAEEMAKNMRAADANIQIAPAIPQGLKPPGQP
jgi:hypothetical protein